MRQLRWFLAYILLMPAVAVPLMGGATYWDWRAMAITAVFAPVLGVVGFLVIHLPLSRKP
jgi:hypothetical protein